MKGVTKPGAMFCTVCFNSRAAVECRYFVNATTLSICQSCVREMNAAIAVKARETKYTGR